MCEKINKLAERLERIEHSLAAAAAGDYSQEIYMEVEAADDLTSVETGINLLISDLADEVKKRKALAAELETYRKEKGG